MKRRSHLHEPGPAAAEGEALATGAVTVVNPSDKVLHRVRPDPLQMVATGGVQPYTWSATGLNPRSSINPSTGLISGLAQAGTWTVTVTASDTAGVSGSTTFRIRVARECRTC